MAENKVVDVMDIVKQLKDVTEMYKEMLAAYEREAKRVTQLLDILEATTSKSKW